MNVKEVTRDLGRIDLILASPECTNRSLAKGNKPRCNVSKNTAFQVTQDLCRVQYRVTGTAVAADVRYCLPNGKIHQHTVSVPFATTNYWFRIGSDPLIEARDKGPTGDLRVDILIESRPDDLYWCHRVPGPYTTNAYGFVRANTRLGVQ